MEITKITSSEKKQKRDKVTQKFQFQLNANLAVAGHPAVKRKPSKLWHHLHVTLLLPIVANLLSLLGVLISLNIQYTVTLLSANSKGESIGRQTWYCTLQLLLKRRYDRVKKNLEKKNTTKKRNLLIKQNGRKATKYKKTVRLKEKKRVSISNYYVERGTGY